jgi:hypothetical protein
MREDLLMKQKVELLILVLVVFLLVSCKANVQAPPVSEENLYVHKDGLYAMTLPAGWTVVQDEEDIKNLALAYKIKNGTVEQLSLSRKQNADFVVIKDTDRVMLEMLSSLSEKEKTRFMKTSMRVAMSHDDKVTVDSVEDIQCAGNRPGILLKGRFKKGSGAFLGFFTVSDSFALLARFTSRDMISADMERDFRKSLESFDFSRKGVSEARKKIETYQRQREEYNRRYGELTKDGFFSGLWMGFACPFKFVINIFNRYIRDDHDPYPYISGHHAKYSYWIGYVPGFIVAVILIIAIRGDW